MLWASWMFFFFLSLLCLTGGTDRRPSDVSFDLWLLSYKSTSSPLANKTITMWWSAVANIACKMEILLSAFSYLTQCKSIPCISDGLASFSPATTVKIWKNVTQRLGAGRAFTNGVTTVMLMGVYTHRKP